MRYLTENGRSVCLVGVSELCSRTPLKMSVSDARLLCGDPEAAFIRGSAEVSSGGADFRVIAVPDAYIPGKNGDGGTAVEFCRPGTPRSSVPSAYAALCGAVIASEKGEKSFHVRSVVASDDSEPEVIDSTMSTEKELTKLSGLLLRFAARAKFEKERAARLLPSLSRLRFPYPSLREGQRELIERVYTAVKRGGRLFAEAPTGIGKTASVLYGSLRAMADGSFRRIFYLTAKQSTRREAFSAASKLAGAADGLRAIVLAPKDAACPYKNTVCDRMRCPLMKNYRNRIGDALKDILSRFHGYPFGTVREAALAAGICPYEFSLDLSEYCDIIICDYNSAFDPEVRLRRYFTFGDPEDAVLLADEAHNLPPRARDCFSAEISGNDLSVLFPFIEEDEGLLDPAEKVADALAACARLCRENSQKDADGLESGWYFSSSIPDGTGLVEAVGALYAALRGFTARRRKDAQAVAAVSPLMRLCSRWLGAAESFNSKYRVYVKLDRGRVSVKLYCLDPSERLDEVLSSVRASVFFSATLTPSDYFADILGGARSAETVSLPSPYPRDNLFVGLLTSADTRWEAREKTSKKICTAVAAAVSAKRGNYMIFFPSYAYLDEVSRLFTAKYPNVKVKIQRRGMDREERNAFLDFFAEDTGVLRVGFCVLGGSFSEGIDLPGDRLIGTVIVGVGLPGLSAEGNIIRDYYETRSGEGYDYAYVYPGMNSVLQAAGRVIRSGTDRGVVILIDDRYAEERYRRLMPPHWDVKSYTDVLSMKEDVARFWSRH